MGLKIPASHKILFTIILFFGLQAVAAPSFDNLSQRDLDSIIRGFSALTRFDSVAPASSLETWGFEIGAVGGLAATPDLQALVDRAGGSADVSELPTMNLIGRMTFPYGLTFEIVGLPPVTISGVTTYQAGAALQWTFTDIWFSRCVDMALKFQYSLSRAAFHQIIQNASTGNLPVDSNLKLTDSVYGIELIVSRSFGLFEPYFSAGYLQSSGDLSVSGSSHATVFSSLFTTAQSAHAGPGSGEGSLGFDFYPFPFLVFGAEIARSYNVNSFIGKLSLQFD